MTTKPKFTEGPWTLKRPDVMYRVIAAVSGGTHPDKLIYSEVEEPINVTPEMRDNNARIMMYALALYKELQETLETLEMVANHCIDEKGNYGPLSNGYVKMTINDARAVLKKVRGEDA